MAKAVCVEGRSRAEAGVVHRTRARARTRTRPKAIRTPASSIGDDSVLVVDTQATPIMAQDVINRIRSVTDKPIKHIVLSHYHAVRVLGASAYGAQNIIASRNTYDLIVERGQQDFDSELGRFPRLFEGVDSVPGLTWPNIVIDGKLTLHLGSVEVQIWHPGRGHTKGDTIVWLPKHKVLYSGDLVEFGATPYTGDAYHEDWPATLDKLLELKPERLVPGRGDALTSAAKSRDAIEGTRAFLADMYGSVKQARATGQVAFRLLQRNVRETRAKVRSLGDLRTLSAVRHHALLRRGGRVPRSAHLDGRARRSDVAFAAERARLNGAASHVERSSESGLSRTGAAPIRTRPRRAIIRSSLSVPARAG